MKQLKKDLRRLYGELRDNAATILSLRNRQQELKAEITDAKEQIDFLLSEEKRISDENFKLG